MERDIYFMIKDVLNSAKILLRSCAKILYGRLPVYIKVSLYSTDGCFSYIAIDDHVYACDFWRDKCIDIAFVKDPRCNAKNVITALIEEIMKCETDESCWFYNNCPFKEELEEAVKLHKLLGESYMKGVDDDLARRVDELKVFARIINETVFGNS